MRGRLFTMHTPNVSTIIMSSWVQELLTVAFLILLSAILFYLMRIHGAFLRLEAPKNNRAHEGMRFLPNREEEENICVPHNRKHPTEQGEPWD